MYSIHSLKLKCTLRHKTVVILSVIMLHILQLILIVVYYPPLYYHYLSDLFNSIFKEFDEPTKFCDYNDFLYIDHQVSLKILEYIAYFCINPLWLLFYFKYTTFIKYYKDSTYEYTSKDILHTLYWTCLIIATTSVFIITSNIYPFTAPDSICMQVIDVKHNWNNMMKYYASTIQPISCILYTLPVLVLLKIFIDMVKNIIYDLVKTLKSELRYYKPIDNTITEDDPSDTNLSQQQLYMDDIIHQNISSTSNLEEKI